ncbi:unnamed protein product [Cylindrotheca closterium]|uniref:Uncharacterized protein n=1 Tax=Cylindrotheca closterium TaxID=2856 RepID=A0AAD2CVK6_9STRA|nr:unnamed protein product [Cylindrotheca closterium]
MKEPGSLLQYSYLLVALLMWMPDATCLVTPSLVLRKNVNVSLKIHSSDHFSWRTKPLLAWSTTDFPGGEDLSNESGIGVNNFSIKEPNPELNGLEVATLCMNALQHEMPQKSLEICFNFSSDRCRAAVGGTLEEFVRYAANPVFGKLVRCPSYDIISVGPIIPGSNVRGDMQTILIQLSKGDGVSEALNQAIQSHNSNVEGGGAVANRRPIEERIAEMDAKMKGETIPKPSEVEGARTKPIRFLWTMQKERRPPRQNCWLVHEVLFVNNAHQLTV